MKQFNISNINLVNEAWLHLHKYLFTSVNLIMEATNVPSNFLTLYVHKISFPFYQGSSVYGKICMKYVQIHFLQEMFCALQVFLCALISQTVCVRTCAQLRGNIEGNGW